MSNNCDLLVLLDQRITSRHPLGTMKFFIIFHGVPSHNCQDISVWTFPIPRARANNKKKAVVSAVIRHSLAFFLRIPESCWCDKLQPYIYIFFISLQPVGNTNWTIKSFYNLKMTQYIINKKYAQCVFSAKVSTLPLFLHCLYLQQSYFLFNCKKSLTHHHIQGHKTLLMQQNELLFSRRQPSLRVRTSCCLACN